MIESTNRRVVLSGGAAALALASLPGEAFAGLDGSNLVAWAEVNTADQKAKMDAYAKLGFRTLSLSIYGEPADPRYACVMVKRANVQAEWTFYPRSLAQMQTEFAAQAARGWGPYLIAATGPEGSAAFAVSFRPMNIMPLTRADLSQAQFETVNAQQHTAGNILGSVDVYGDAANPRFAAIWIPNPDRVAWSIHGFDVANQTQELLENADRTQQRFNAVTASWARPTRVAAAPGGTFLSLYTDTSIGAWSSHAEMTAAEFQSTFNANAKAGLWPVDVSARGVGSSARFAAVFTSREEIAPRQWRTNGTPSIAGIDQILQAFVQSENLRGAALAICQGSRLVYAQGYNMAEPGYPDITPTTPIRQASISKTFTGVAIQRLLQDDPTFKLTTKVGSILNIKQPNGSAPKSAYWNDLTIKNLLESDSGLDQRSAYDVLNAIQATGGSFPLTPARLISYAAQFDFSSYPGDPTNVVYGNFDYIILGQIVAAKAGFPGDYLAGLKKLVLDPLHQVNTHLARSRAADQPAGEARHHMTVFDPAADWALYPFEVVGSTVEAGQKLAATHYGWLDLEVFSGAGGLSSSVVDMARLGAMFSSRSGNPVLRPDQIDAMLTAVNTAGATLLGPDGKGGLKPQHGYYGLDWCQMSGSGTTQVFTAEKGGWLPGQGTILHFTTGGFTYCLAINGNADVKYDWLTPLDAFCQNYTFSNADLFETVYKLPALSSFLVPPGFKLGAVPKVTLNPVKASMGRGFAAVQKLRRAQPAIR